jgi:hypothetical protein
MWKWLGLTFDNGVRANVAKDAHVFFVMKGETVVDVNTAFSHIVQALYTFDTQGRVARIIFEELKGFNDFGLYLR